MTKNNGGPAFPATYLWWDEEQAELAARGTQQGMSLRDWYKGLAMQAIYTGGLHKGVCFNGFDEKKPIRLPNGEGGFAEKPRLDMNSKDVAEWAGEIADSMIGEKLSHEAYIAQLEEQSSGDIGKDLTEHMESQASYIGDGAYVAYDGYFWVWADRENGRHVVALEPEMIAALQKFMDQNR